MKKFVYASFAGVILGGVPLMSGAQVASADAVSMAKSDTAIPVSDSLVSRIDDYVVVKDNQYVLELPDNAKTLFTSDEIAVVKTNLYKANENVNKNALAIDVENKTTESEPQVMTAAAYNKHVTTKNFWWGTRYYFTSNAAVDEFVWSLNNTAIGLGAAIGVVGGAYFAKVANDLNYYNQTHSHNQIYMDVNWSFFYSCHVLN